MQEEKHDTERKRGRCPGVHPGYATDLNLFAPTDWTA